MKIKKHSLVRIQRTVLLLLIAACLLLLSACQPSDQSDQQNADAGFTDKISLLRQEIFNDSVTDALGPAPAGDAGFAVFISVCDGNSRAKVFTGTGADLKTAWSEAESTAAFKIRETELYPRWVKADIVASCRVVDGNTLKKEVRAARHEFYREGLSLDSNFDVAFLEAEMNGAKIYEYDDGGVDLDYLNTYLKKTDREPVESLPDEYTLFQCWGWFCDEDNTVYPLIREGLDYGRREVEHLDADYAKSLIDNASAFLLNQVKEDGTFNYGIYPRFDNDIENYNIVRHASTIWSLICRYRMSPDEELAQTIDKTIDYLITQVIYDENGAAYLYEAKDDEIKLGGCGVAVIALTEYMDAFQNEKYLDLACQLGEGILTMLDQETGTYWHVLNGDFSRKEEFRTVYYDGEATFGLCRLYTLTGDVKWRDAACSAVDHFIRDNYEQHKDHWVAYSVNELTKCGVDNPEYYAFGLRNAEKNLKEIGERDTTYHTYLELLMASFELYDRMVEKGMDPGDFDLQKLLDTISIRANRQLNGYFFPEYAMYMANPQRILNTFMVRHDGYRIRIDDVQHNIGGYYLYWKNYDKMVEYGLHV